MDTAKKKEMKKVLAKFLTYKRRDEEEDEGWMRRRLDCVLAAAF